MKYSTVTLFKLHKKEYYKPLIFLEIQDRKSLKTYLTPLETPSLDFDMLDLDRVLLQFVHDFIVFDRNRQQIIVKQPES